MGCASVYAWCDPVGMCWVGEGWQGGWEGGGVGREVGIETVVREGVVLCTVHVG
jgi:hypothetical protein